MFDTHAKVKYAAVRNDNDWTFFSARFVVSSSKVDGNLLFGIGAAWISPRCLPCASLIANILPRLYTTRQINQMRFP